MRDPVKGRGQGRGREPEQGKGKGERTVAAPLTALPRPALPTLEAILQLMPPDDEFGRWTLSRDSSNKRWLVENKFSGRTHVHGQLGARWSRLNWF